MKMILSWWGRLREILRPLPSGDVMVKIRAVRRIFADVDRATCSFKKASHLSCPERCSHCCSNSNVETSVLELLPLADVLISRGEADYWLEAAGRRDFPGQCVFYLADEACRDEGRCAFYALRPLICRMFGYSANRDKKEQVRFVACAHMKRLAPVPVEDALQQVVAGKITPPVMAEAIMKVVSLEPGYGAETFPINEALAKALDRVQLYRKYR